MDSRSEVRNRQRPGAALQSVTSNERPTQPLHRNAALSNGDDEQRQDATTNSVSTSAWRRFLKPFMPSTPEPSTVDPEPHVEEQQPPYQDIKPLQIEHYSKGIPRLAALLDSDESFCVVRRFGPETARLLLYRQFELHQLSSKIRELDKAEEGEEGNDALASRLTSMQDKGKWSQELQKSWKEFEDKTLAYHELALRYSDMKSLKKAPMPDYRSIFSWVTDHAPLADNEYDWLLSVDDFVSVKKDAYITVPRGNWMEEKIASFAQKNPRHFFSNRLKSNNSARKTSNELVHYWSNESIAALIRLIVALLALGTVLLPVLIIFLVQPSRPVIVSIVAVFVTTFLLAFCVLVEVTPVEIFVGTAAYSAVLVALLSNMMNQ